MSKQQIKRRPNRSGRVYKDKGVFYLQYTDRDKKRKAMILRDEKGEKVTNERQAETVARKFLDRYYKLKDIETKEELLAEKAKLKKLKARLTIPLEDAFDISLQKPHKRIARSRVLKVTRRYWVDFVGFLQDNYQISGLDEVTRTHAEAYISHIRQHGRWKRIISYSAESCRKRKKFKDYEFGGTLSNTTLNRYQSTCKAVFTFLAPDLGYAIEDNPFFHIIPLKLEPVEREIFSEEELQKIFADPPPLMEGLFTIGLYTGLREGDVATLRWSEIEKFDSSLKKQDFYGREIIRVTRKTKTLVKVPIDYELSVYLAKQYKISGQEEYILPEAATMYLDYQNRLTNRILGYLHSLGITTNKDVPGRKRKQSVKDFHSLRHCFCYYAGMRGVPLPVVQSIVGHMTQSMTRHYQSHADKEARMQGLALMRGLAGRLWLTPDTENKEDELRERIMNVIRQSPEDILQRIMAGIEQFTIINPSTGNVSFGDKQDSAPCVNS